MPFDKCLKYTYEREEGKKRGEENKAKERKMRKNLRRKECMVSLYVEYGPFPPQALLALLCVLDFIYHELFLPSPVSSSQDT